MTKDHREKNQVSSTSTITYDREEEKFYVVTEGGGKKPHKVEATFAMKDNVFLKISGGMPNITFKDNDKPFSLGFYLENNFEKIAKKDLPIKDFNKSIKDLTNSLSLMVTSENKFLLTTGTDKLYLALMKNFIEKNLNKERKAIFYEKLGEEVKLSLKVYSDEVPKFGNTADAAVKGRNNVDGIENRFDKITALLQCLPQDISSKIINESVPLLSGKIQNINFTEGDAKAIEKYNNCVNSNNTITTNNNKIANNPNHKDDTLREKSRLEEILEKENSKDKNKQDADVINSCTAGIERMNRTLSNINTYNENNKYINEVNKGDLIKRSQDNAWNKVVEKRVVDSTQQLRRIQGHGRLIESVALAALKTNGIETPTTADFEKARQKLDNKFSLCNALAREENSEEVYAIDFHAVGRKALANYFAKNMKAPVSIESALRIPEILFEEQEREAQRNLENAKNAQKESDKNEKASPEKSSKNGADREALLQSENAKWEKSAPAAAKRTGVNMGSRIPEAAEKDAEHKSETMRKDDKASNPWQKTIPTELKRDVTQTLKKADLAAIEKLKVDGPNKDTMSGKQASWVNKITNSRNNNPSKTP
ncbi:MAG: hypothetical protein IPP74_06755 [Alphaproteobacteria bacterium]|nr:hypothetical protein [Alphaproteobacteria bacterium]